ncbi:MAG: ComF family protein [Lentisphaeria bacterium]|nr:ComF family protein [Lentisphaeria bacterium]
MAETSLPRDDLISRIGRAAGRLARTGGTWVLPNVCPACRSQVCLHEQTMCPACSGRLRELPGPRCPRCGGVVDGPLAVCGECLAGDPGVWKQAVTVYGYEGFIRDLIHQMKYQQAVFLVPFMAGKMAESWRRGQCAQPDVATWVPMHWWRKTRRGYNQAELLAREVGRILDIPARKLVRRKKNSRKQVTLGEVERRENVKGAFVSRRGRLIADKHVLLIDDVFTTGATLRAVTQAISEHAPSHISVLTLARG